MAGKAEVVMLIRREKNAEERNEKLFLLLDAHPRPLNKQ